MPGGTTSSTRDTATFRTLREALALNAHEEWTRWMEYFLGKCAAQADGTVVVDAQYAAALRRQMATPYGELEPAVQDLDRAEADLQLAIVKAVVGSDGVDQ
jgi:hypothetical protein